MSVHESIMRRFANNGFVGYDTLSLSVVPGQGFLLEGEIACKGRIVISVRKFLGLVPRGGEFDVQTNQYAYNVRVMGQGTVFRYDNHHVHAGHQDAHHKDVYRFPSDEKIGALWVGEAGWPTLGEVIDEAMRWHSDHYAELLAPEDFVPPSDLATQLRD